MGENKNRDISGSALNSQSISGWPDKKSQERLIRRLLILNQVSMAMQSTLELDRLLHIVLSGITAGEGLGFNRAVLFLTNKERTELVGRMGVGPMNHEECQHIWSETFARQYRLDDFLLNFEQVRKYEQSELNQRVRRMRIPLKASAGVIALTALEKKPYLIENASQDSRVNTEILSLLECDVFATAPLIAAGEIYGVIVVDNRFTRRPIRAEDIQVLTLLANQAAVGVHNARQVTRIQRFNQELEQEVHRATSELEAANQQLRERVDELSALNRIAVSINATNQLEPQLDLIIDEATKILQSPRGAIILLEKQEGPRRRFLRVLNTRGNVDFDRRLTEFESGQGLLYQVIESGQPRMCNEGCPASNSDGTACSILAVPMRLGEGVIGAIMLERKIENEFSKEDLGTLVMLSMLAAEAIRNAQIYERLEKQYKELRRTQKELVKNEKLAVLGEMAAIVAHEIRNPLTAVKGFSQRMKRKAPGNESIERYSRIIVEEVDRLDEVIADVLDFARRAAPKWEDVDVVGVIQQTVDLLSGGIENANVVLSLELPENLPVIRGDSGQLRQVFLNICSNALQAMPEGGALGIEVTCQDGWIHVTIQDTGCGIPEDKGEKVFQPFYTTRTHGTGLGLALAQHIIDDHGGHIGFESELGQGTTFRIDLPVKTSVQKGANQ